MRQLDQALKKLVEQERKKWAQALDELLHRGRAGIKRHIAVDRQSRKLVYME